jgi:hypothetical protein
MITFDQARAIVDRGLAVREYSPFTRAEPSLGEVSSR